MRGHMPPPGGDSFPNRPIIGENKRMKKIRVEDAVGMTLCHDLTEMKDGFKGPAFRRGHVIKAEDIPHMLDMGKRHVFVWEENAGEIHE